MKTWRIFAAACFSLMCGAAAAEDLPRYTAAQEANVRQIQTMVGSGALAALKTGGVPRFDYLKSVVADDFVADLSSGMPYGRVFHGWQGYQELMAEIKKFWSGLRMVDPSFIPFGDDKVIIHFTLDGHIRKNNRHVAMPVVSIWGLKNGKANTFRVFYFDTKLVTDLAAK